MAYYSKYGRYQQLDASPSRVLKWMKCPKAFEYQYVRRVPSTTGLAAMQGTALHDVFLEEMLRGGSQDVPALVELLELTFRDALEQCYFFDECYHSSSSVSSSSIASKAPFNSLNVWLSLS